MKEHSGVDLSYKNTLTYGEAKNRDNDDEDEDNVVLLTLDIRRGQCCATRQSF